MKTIITLCALILALSVLNSEAATITKPYTFTNGTTSDASQVNANFDTLYTQVNTNSADIATLQAASGSGQSGITSLSTRIVTAGAASDTTATYASQVKFATCQSGEVITGGSCSCTHSSFNSSTTNYGVLMSCQVSGNSISGFCAADTYSASSYKYGPPFTAYAICMSATLTNTTTRSAMRSRNTENGIPDEEAQQDIQNMEKTKAEYVKAIEEKLKSQTGKP